MSRRLYPKYRPLPPGLYVLTEEEVIFLFAKMIKEDNGKNVRNESALHSVWNGGARNGDLSSHKDQKGLSTFRK
jgi:hypothetical protein